MKSLEALKNIRREAGLPYFSTFYDIDMWNEDFETIKQDLEVLEILRKCMIRGSIIYNDLSKLYEFEMYEMFNEETSNKLKQWLEENKE